MEILKTKLKAGKYMQPVNIKTVDGRMYFCFGYCPALIDEIKSGFEKRKWHGEEKMWSAPVTQRNLFRLNDLMGKYGNNPYAPWDKIDYDHHFETRFPLYRHQRQMVNHGLFCHWFIWAAEMGTGKTLAAFTLMELSGFDDWIWVGPKSALRAVMLEQRKWGLRIEPEYHTYESLKKLVTQWEAGLPAPHGIIFDESSKLKNPTSQRSVAAKHLADSIRADHGWEKSFIGLLSGSPAPKSPADWHHQCEVACPGFLREANIHVFKNRLGVIESRELVQGGGVYPYLVSWRDDENKCNKCGQLRDDPIHTIDDVFDKLLGQDEDTHEFVPSVNEVAKLYRRMNGLVLVKLKKDCTDLPEKIYDVIRVEPSAETLRLARLIVAKSTRAIEALTLLRELSDGFQYQEVEEGIVTCPLCRGTKTSIEWYDPQNEDILVTPEEQAKGVRFIYNDQDEVVEEVPIEYKQRVVTCVHCNGNGEVPRLIRSMFEVLCPKDDVVREQLDLHDDVGRLNIYAGFQASVDRLCKICLTAGWGYIRADGRGWDGLMPTGERLPNKELLSIYSQGQGRIAFIGQAGAAGMGLTLTASPTTLFFSNDFNGENRLQAEDRGHRIGMDVERGGRILDIVHLETDQYILDNLKKKKDLQLMSMTGLRSILM
jgi:hypothetical protein